MHIIIIYNSSTRTYFSKELTQWMLVGWLARVMDGWMDGWMDE